MEEAALEPVAEPAELEEPELELEEPEEPELELVEPVDPELEPAEPAEPEPELPEPAEPAEPADPAFPPVAAVPLVAVPAVSSTPCFEAVTPKAWLKVSAAVGSPFLPLMAVCAERQVATVEAGALHWSFKRSQMNWAMMPGS